jgi:hypothetical protein
MLFKEVIAIYSEKHTKPINTKHSVAYLLRRLGHIITAKVYKIKLVVMFEPC